MAETTPVKNEKFGFDTDFFEVAVSAHAVGGIAVAQPKPPKNIQAAKEEGYAAAKAELGSIYEAANAQQQAQVSALVAAIEPAQTAWQQQVLQQCLGLLRVSLHKIIGHAAANYPEQMLEMHLKSLLEHIKTQEDLTLRVAPEAREYHEKLGLSQANIHGRTFQIIPDTRLGPTDCVVEWKHGGLEALLSEHLAQLDDMFARLHVARLEVPPTLKNAVLPTQASDILSAPEQTINQAKNEAEERAKALLGDDELVDALK